MSMAVTANAKCFLVPGYAALHMQAFFTDTDSSSGSNPSGLQSASGRTNGSRGTCPLAQQCGLACKQWCFLYMQAHHSQPFTATLDQSCLTFRQFAIECQSCQQHIVRSPLHPLRSSCSTCMSITKEAHLC